MKPIYVQFKYTREELWHTTAALGKSLSRGSSISQWIGSGLMVISVLAVTWQHFPIRDLLLPFFLGAVLTFSPLFLTRWMVLLAWKKVPFANKQSIWTISEEELVSEIDGMRTSFGWEKIVKVREDKNGFLLFTSPTLAHWFPKHGFSSVEDLEAFRALIRKKEIVCRA